jgi:MoaA/NifB/PqqE/SkfB family radical SAM enzyme
MHMVLLEPPMRDEMLNGSRDWKARTNEVLARATETARSLQLSVNLPPPFVLDGAGGKPEKAAPIRCWFLWQRMYVGPFGEVVPCCLAGIHKNGDVAQSDFFSEWNSPLYREMRRRVHSDDPYAPCADCYLVHRNTDTGDFEKLEVPLPG